MAAPISEGIVCVDAGLQSLGVLVHRVGDGDQLLTLRAYKLSGDRRPALAAGAAADGADVIHLTIGELSIELPVRGAGEETLLTQLPLRPWLEVRARASAAGKYAITGSTVAVAGQARPAAAAQRASAPARAPLRRAASRVSARRRADPPTSTTTTAAAGRRRRRRPPPPRVRRARSPAPPRPHSQTANSSATCRRRRRGRRAAGTRGCTARPPCRS